MSSRIVTRREMLEKCIMGGSLLAAAPMPDTRLLELWTRPRELYRLTPACEMGPFFKKGAAETTSLRLAGDPGLPLTVTGAFTDLRGDDVHDAWIDVWQTDHFGRYDLSGYRYRGRISAVCGNGYSFETVMPGHYPDRVAQHIHIMVTGPTIKTLVTQLCFATDRAFEGDPDRFYKKDPVIRSRELIRPVLLYDIEGSTHASVTFDLRVEKI